MAEGVSINDFGEEMYAYLGDAVVARARRQRLATDNRRWHWVVTTSAARESTVETKDRARHVLRQFVHEQRTARAFASRNNP
jgi:hypothetical protein